jgi:hypothetical protein
MGFVHCHTTHTATKNKIANSTLATNRPLLMGRPSPRPESIIQNWLEWSLVRLTPTFSCRASKKVAPQAPQTKSPVCCNER